MLELALLCSVHFSSFLFLVILRLMLVGICLEFIGYYFLSSIIQSSVQLLLSWVFGLDFFGYYFISSIIIFKVQLFTFIDHYVQSSVQYWVIFSFFDDSIQSSVQLRVLRKNYSESFLNINFCAARHESSQRPT